MPTIEPPPIRALLAPAEAPNVIIPPEPAPTADPDEVPVVLTHTDAVENGWLCVIFGVAIMLVEPLHASAGRLLIAANANVGWFAAVVCVKSRAFPVWS